MAIFFLGAFPLGRALVVALLETCVNEGGILFRREKTSRKFNGNILTHKVWWSYLQR